jgi:hypothetical protein
MPSQCTKPRTLQLFAMLNRSSVAYLFVFLKKKLSNGKVSVRMFHLFVSRKQLGAIKTCLSTKAGSIHYPQIQNTKLMCLCEEVRRSNLLFFIGFPLLKLSKSLNNCNLPTYFNELRLEVTWQIASSYLLAKTRFS